MKIKRLFTLIVVLVFSFMLSSCDMVGGIPGLAITTDVEDESVNKNIDIQYLYNLALENGYTGTYQDWIDELKGEAGASISGIEKKSSQGNVDTYQISLSNGSSFEFNVTNGAKGDTGDKGDKGDRGMGIKKMEFNTDKELIITYDDGSTVNVGKLTFTEHVHTYEIETINATCTQAGYYTLTCASCGEVKTININPTGHSYGLYRETKVATCTVDGEKTRTCLICGYQDKVVVEKHNHNFSTTYLYNNNLHWKYCTLCGVVESEGEHSYQASNVCTVCGHEHVSSTESTDGLIYALREDGTSYALIDVGTCTDKDITIDSIYNNLPVVEIFPNVFKNNSVVESVTMPNTITTIGEYCFSGCSNLTRVSLSNNIELIPNYCFGSCRNLSEVVITENVKKIGMCSFENCIKIESIVIPNSVEEIGSGAFSSCFALKNVQIGSNVKTIGTYCFSNCDISSIVLPDKLLTLENSVLCNNNNLESVTLGKYTEFIGEDAFCSCNKLKNIHLSDSVYHIGNNAFSNTAIESITIPENVVQLGSNVFNNCSSLTQVIFENTENWTCGSTKIYKEIAENPTLVKKYFTETYTNSSWTCSKYYYKQYSLWNGMTQTHYNEYGIYKNGSNTDSITSIEIESTFNGLPITAIGSYAYSYCSNLENIVIPSTIKRIESYAFSYCENLKEVVIPNTVEYIGERIVGNCPNLESITIPFIGEKNEFETGDAMYIFPYIFGSYAGDDSRYYYTGTMVECYNSNSQANSGGYVPVSLKKVIVTNASYIPYDAFLNCNMIEEIYINGTFTTINNNSCFNQCTSLTKLCILTDCDIDSSLYVYNVIGNINLNCKIYCYNTLYNKLKLESTYTNRVYSYSATEPTDSGNYWHYVNDEITIWEK